MKRIFPLILFIIFASSIYSRSSKLHLVFTNNIHGAIHELPARFINPEFSPLLAGGAGAYTWWPYLVAISAWLPYLVVSIIPVSLLWPIEDIIPWIAGGCIMHRLHLHLQRCVAEAVVALGANKKKMYLSKRCICSCI